MKFKLKPFSTRALMPLVLALAAATSTLPAQNAATLASAPLRAYEPAPPPLPGYRLAWSDEFDGGKLNTNRWHYRIDICEQDAVNTRSYSAGVIDWSGRTGERSAGFGRKYYRDTADFAAGFHVWGCEFTADSVKFYLDGKLTHQTDAKQFPHGPQNIWLTCVAVLWGDPAKPKAVDDARLPAWG
jgi:beta-glucanase (GH16 family)